MRDKAQIAYNIIKDKILKGELPPLSDISEESLQDELDISRTPVREAIQKLKKEGFVYIYSRKGTIVSDITVDLTKSIYEVRALNEPYAARCACGAQIVVFTSGRGTPTGNPLAPVIKVTGNRETYAMMQDNIDVDASHVIYGPESLEELGAMLLEEVVEVAKGKLTKAEVLGFVETSVQRVCNYA